MAKIKGPLFSIEGLGKINKSIIYSKNKGIKTAKRYKVPANPKSTDQQSRREFMRLAVLAWKTDGYNSIDIEAWNLYAKAIKKKASGYNMFLRFYINALAEGKTFRDLIFKEDLTFSDTSTNLWFYGSNLSEPVVHVGESIKWFPDTYNWQYEGADELRFWVAHRVVGTKYYYWIEGDDSGNYVRTGIYSFIQRAI